MRGSIKSAMLILRSGKNENFIQDFCFISRPSIFAYGRDLCICSNMDIGRL